MLQRFLDLEASEKIEGIYFDVPDEVYHHPLMPGVSGSQLKLFHESPFVYEYEMNAEKKETEALFYGRAFHCAILTPEIYDETYAVLPDVNGTTKEGKAAIKEVKDANEGKTFIKWKDNESIMFARTVLHSNPVVKRLVDNCKKEVTFLWYDEDTGLLCRGKVDLINIEQGVIGDVKTCDSCKEFDFSRAVSSHFYDLSAAFYLDGATQVLKKYFRAFAYVAIEKKPPYLYDLFFLNSESITTGRDLYKKTLERFKLYKQDKSAFKRPDKFREISMPNWAHDLTKR